MKTTTLTDLPHSDYQTAWMAFREASKENDVIANWVIQQWAWPKKTGIKLTDIGCGDGKVVGSIIDKSGGNIASVNLIEPHEPFLKESEKHLRAKGVQPKIFHTTLEKAPAECFSADVILLSHVIYLVVPEEFMKLLNRLPKKVPLYVAFDDPRSVFSLLWKKTAPKYLERVLRAHETIKQLPVDKYEVLNTALTSKFDKELLQPQNPRSQALISMLCYNNTLHVSGEGDFQNYFWKTVSENTVAGKVQCRFIGYQIVKK